MLKNDQLGLKSPRTSTRLCSSEQHFDTFSPLFWFWPSQMWQYGCISQLSLHPHILYKPQGKAECAPPAQRLMTGSWSKQVAGEETGASSKSRIHASTQLLMVTKLKLKGERNMMESCCFSVTNLCWQHRRFGFLRSCRKQGFGRRLKTGLYSVWMSKTPFCFSFQPAIY